MCWMEGLPVPQSFKVHARLCSGLRYLVDIVSEIVPEIEATRPRAAGMEALCHLNILIHKAKSLLHHCTDSSILFLVLAGDTILSRCKNLKHLIKHSLRQIQTTVPLALAAKISRIILAVTSVVFCLDSSEKEATRELSELLYAYNVGLTEEFALSAIHAVCSRLQISSPKALQIEKSSITRLIDKFGQGEKRTMRRKVLIFFQNLLSKYSECSHEECRTDLFMNWPEPPKEFLCPLSMRLMHDPVVIASGVTYNRASIQQWFEEGHDTCPETNEKLDQLSFITNAVMKDIISKWCTTHHFSSTPDANTQGTMVKPWTLMSINSIGSFASCIDNLNLH